MNAFKCILKLIGRLERNVIFTVVLVVDLLPSAGGLHDGPVHSIIGAVWAATSLATLEGWKVYSSSSVRTEVYRLRKD